MEITVKIKKDEYVGSVAYWADPTHDVYICTTMCTDGTVTVAGHVGMVFLPCVHVNDMKSVREYAHAILRLAKSIEKEV